ncbi:NAD-binding protein [Niastella yeongjuensis]|uniref:NAD-binding protein n=1 Tax=Niastella yeongjuensis TaxID=354355 RepID=A0A1V9F7G6_9BACT|nr:Gfo/Idh/MocA family oxidoreductase [Niastella yeongjuensis]OQP54304.1 NAD-binding protein [Niastella yeongjuensis]SEP30613.1 Predicted dehydrogenase [Niastella yeongjuensis]
MKKVRWGILSTAKIAREKVIPAMQTGVYCEIVAIASRKKEQAQETANKLGIPVVYGSYEELLNDKNIDAVYIPLPNHMHVEWTLKAIQAGKHVLCEKPIALSAEQATQLIQAAGENPQLKVMEAFMYRFHPQWVQAKKLVDDGRIGPLKTIHSFFSYYNADPNNIRNQKDLGGGGMMDIGCYCVSLARFLFDSEPVRVLGHVTTDPVLQTDTMTSGILEFTNGTATFTCSTQLMPYQRVQIMGTEGRIEIEIPFNAPPNQVTRLWLYTKAGVEEMQFDPVDQYTLQGDLFALSVLNNTPVPTPLQDAVNNMKVIETVLNAGLSSL